MLTFTGPVTVYVTVDPRELRHLIRRELQPLKEQLMSVAEDLATVRDTFTSTLADIAVKIQRLQDAVDNPETADTLTPESQAILDELKQLAADTRASVGDENADGVPAAPPVDEPTV